MATSYSSKTLVKSYQLQKLTHTLLQTDEAALKSFRCGFYDQAIDLCTRSMKVQKKINKMKETNESIRDDTFALRAKSYLMMKEYKQGLNDLEEMERLDGDAYFGRGQARFYLGDYEFAMVEFVNGLRWTEKEEKRKKIVTVDQSQLSQSLKNGIKACKSAILSQLQNKKGQEEISSVAPVIPPIVLPTLSSLDSDLVDKSGKKKSKKKFAKSPNRRTSSKTSRKSSRTSPTRKSSGRSSFSTSTRKSLTRNSSVSKHTIKTSIPNQSGEFEIIPYDRSELDRFQNSLQSQTMSSDIPEDILASTQKTSESSLPPPNPDTFSNVIIDDFSSSQNIPLNQRMPQSPKNAVGSPKHSQARVTSAKSRTDSARSNSSRLNSARSNSSRLNSTRSRLNSARKNNGEKRTFRRASKVSDEPISATKARSKSSVRRHRPMFFKSLDVLDEFVPPQNSHNSRFHFNQADVENRANNFGIPIADPLKISLYQEDLRQRRAEAMQDYQDQASVDSDLKTEGDRVLDKLKDIRLNYLTPNGDGSIHPNQYKMALETLRKILLTIHLNELDKTPNAYTSLYQLCGECHKAIDQEKMSIFYYEKMADVSKRYKLWDQFVIATSEIALMYEKSGRFEDALKQLKQKIPKLSRRDELLFNWWTGRCLHKLKRHPKSVEYYEKSFQLSRESRKDIEAFLTICLEVAMVYEEMGEFDRAIEKFKVCHETAKNKKEFLQRDDDALSGLKRVYGKLQS